MLVFLAAFVLFAAELDPVVVSGESKPTATRLVDARRLQDAGKSAQAVTQLLGLIEAGADDLVSVSPTRSIRVREQVHTALARLDKDSLAAYRVRTESRAKRLLDEGANRRVVEDFFCTKSALTALDRLGDAAFILGRYDEAEQWWSAIAPLPTQNEVAARPLPRTSLVHPDPTPAQVARAKAKQLLAQRFAGRADWVSSLSAYRKEHPTDSGPLAGELGGYADLLAKTTITTRDDRDCLTFGGDASRGRVFAGSERLLDNLAQLCRKGPKWAFNINRREQLIGGVDIVRRENAREAATRLAYYPVLLGHNALVSDGRRVVAYDLNSGTVTEWFDAAKVLKRMPKEIVKFPLGNVRYSLTAEAGHVFARLGTSLVRDVRPNRSESIDDAESLIVCLKDGKECWRAHAYDAVKKEFAVFEGTPVVVGDRCYVAASRFEGDRVITAIYCYPAFAEEMRPAPLWKADICETRELQTASTGEGRKTRERHHLITLAGGRIVYCSHSGVVASLDPISGARVWAVRYPRREIVEVEDEPTLRDLAPPVSAEGLLYVAPSDSDVLLCLDPATGETIWQRERLDVVHLLGVGKGRLIFTTWRNPSLGRIDAGGLRAVDAFTGRDDNGWILPDDGGGLIPFGRGQLVGDLVLWPTHRRPFGVVAVRQEDGRQPDNPALLHRIPSGNLLYAGGILLVTDRQVMFAYVPSETFASEKGQSEREKLGQYLQKKRFDAIRSDPVLARLDVRDERGLPQSAKQVIDQPIPNRSPLVCDSFSRLDVRLRRDETFLPLPGGEAFLTTRQRSLVRRTAKGISWEVSLGFTPTWATVCGSLFVVAGPSAVAAVTNNGSEAWHWPSPARPRYPTSNVSEVRVYTDVLPSEPLSTFRVEGETIYVVQAGRLFALNAVTGRCRWFYEASLFGRILAIWPMGTSVLLQVPGRREIIDARTGQRQSRYEDSFRPWPREPLAVQGDVIVVPDANRVQRIDQAGRIVWEVRPSGRTTRSGEAPFVVSAIRDGEGNPPGTARGTDLVLIVPENIGLRLQTLDAATGKLAANAPLLHGPADPRAWCRQANRLWCIHEGRLKAWDQLTGKPAFDLPTRIDGEAHLAIHAGRLIAWPREGPAVRLVVRWRWVAVQCKCGPWPGLADCVEAYSLDDPIAKPVVNRLDPDHLPRVWDEVSLGGVVPSFSLDREARVPGPVLQVGSGGVLCALGDCVQSVQLSK